MELYGSEDVGNKQVSVTDGEGEGEEDTYLHTLESSDITDIDATPPREESNLHMSSIVSEEEIIPKEPHRLLSILNGNRNKKRKVVEVEVEEEIPEPETLEELEKKIYSKIKSTSITSFFSSYKSKKEFSSFITLQISPEKLRNIRRAQQLPLKNTIDHNEFKMFENAKRTSARDIFSNFKPKETEIKQQSEIKQLKLVHMVTIKLEPKYLAKFKENPLRTKGNNVNGTSYKSVFASMMTASKNNKSLTTKQIKEMELPSISKSQFHVTDEIISYLPTSTLPALQKKLHVQDPEDISGLVPPLNIPKSKSHYTYTYTNINKSELALNKISNLHKAKQLQTIFEKLNQPTNASQNLQPWVNKYQPEQMSNLIMHKHNIKQIKNWIENSFLKLKNQAPVKDLKQKLKKRKIDNFLIDDDETEEEIYSPFLILQGSCGSGKSTSVYTAMKELNGYVHEINTGISRSRKDIYNILKELCTTQLVNDTKEFQKGLILFEDVNILFEQDKTFWQVVQDIINVSKRPIIITCEEIWNIPKNLIEFAQDDNSIIFIDDYLVSKKLISDYLWLCCLNENYNVDDNIINEIIDNNWNGNNYNLKGCLNQCEMLCKVQNLQQQIIKIEKIKDDEVDKGNDDLLFQAQQFDLNSASDVISSNSKTQIPFKFQKNEFIDLYYIDDLNNFKTLPFEFNCGKELKPLITTNLSNQPILKFKINDLMYDCQNFIGSRLKKFSKLFYQIDNSRATRSSSIESNNSFEINQHQQQYQQGIPENSFLYNIPPQTLILDLLPFVRNWSSFQIEINKFENESLKLGKASIKKFLKYRDFLINEFNLLNTLPNLNSLISDEMIIDENIKEDSKENNNENKNEIVDENMDENINGTVSLESRNELNSNEYRMNIE
ncbi:uncharacterized protein KGF55_003837 [Candida pseudojiufengensis]|uniref:uncharacterized protein n=1 Tax=Candida pseudojiufengensis TaxID=497109 RepID=UPI0022259B88|nr:uncharacterized protein KGF55_003837 [Candida pseudojiufengensis]KAI5961866.1 hypothetical protein KGF55_003837 [Candida pseudojiufengensis]